MENRTTYPKNPISNAADELGLDELSDPEHLPPEQLAIIVDLAKIKEKLGIELACPITRALINGYLLREAGIDISEPGYPDNTEIADCVNELVDAQYGDSMGTLRTFHLYNPEQAQEGDVPAPTLEQVSEILTSRITPDQLEVIKRMEKPTLQLIPITSMARYEEALNSYKPMKNQIDANVSPWHRGAFARADERDGVKDNNTIIGWRIAVTEGAKEPKLLTGDDIKKTLRERATWFVQEYAEKGVSGVDLKRMLLLMMASLEEGKPINDYIEQDGTWTFVNGEPEEDGFVSGVDWHDDVRQVLLHERYAGLQNDGARLRASVVFDVPKS